MSETSAQGLIQELHALLHDGEEEALEIFLRLVRPEDVAEWLDLHAGGVVLWIGNTGPVLDTQSGNLQEIYYRLGGPGRTPIRYEDMFVVAVPDEGPTHIIKATYGGPSSLD